MAFNTYHNPTAVTIGSNAALTGVVAIRWSNAAPEIIAAADGDTQASVARYGTKVTRGSISFIDPVQAYTALDQSGTLTATLTHLKGATNATLTIEGLITGAESHNVVRDGVSTSDVSFVAEAAPSVA